MRKANYQNGIASGIAGWQYTGDELGTFDGSFYGNYTSYYITGSLFNAMAAYIAAGNNSFTIYNPYPSASSQGYSYNYLQWSSVIITITYEEAVSQPTVSSSSVNLGSAVTIYTNRQSTATTHTLLYSFGSTSGTIASNVGASVSWTPPLSLASQIPSATSGICTITCQSYNGGTLTGTRTCTVTLNVPSTVVPSISSVTVEDTNTTVVSRIAAFVKGLSTLSVAITAAGVYGSTISSYRTSLDGVIYTAASFTATKKLSVAGDMTMTVTVTDSRGRTATYTTTFNVLDYSPPSITAFSAERCNSDGSAAQLDGTKARYSFAGKVTALNNKNGLSCVVYYKLKSATAWTTAEQMAITSYTLSATNKLLSKTFDALYSYDLKVRLTDYFYYVEQAVSIGTKGVILDFMADGTGIGIGKVAETSGYIDCGWPLKLSSALAVNRLLTALKKGLVNDFQVIERLGLDALHVVNANVHGVVDQSSDGSTTPEACSALRFNAACIGVLSDSIRAVPIVYKQVEYLPDDCRFLFVDNKVSDWFVLFVQPSLIFQFVAIWDMATPVQALLHHLRMLGFHTNGGFLAFPRSLPEPNVVQ